MRRTCQHCARPFREGTGEGDFCCSGCRQVYELIGAEGLGDFYALQDQMGRPVGDVRDSAVDRSELSRLQRDAEQSKPEIHVRVDGMSCLGCVWLVERIAKAESGVVSARVSLQENRLVLGWRPGSFDLGALAVRLQAFGYRLGGCSSGLAATWSLLTWRLVLCGIFALNAILLALPQWLGGDISAYENVLSLLALLFAGLGLFVGASHFVGPVLRSWRVGLLHYDSLAVCGLLAFIVQGALAFYALGEGAVLWELPLFVFSLLAVRWLHLSAWDCLASSMEDPVRGVEDRSRLDSGSGFVGLAACAWCGCVVRAGSVGADCLGPIVSSGTGGALPWLCPGHAGECWAVYNGFCSGGCLWLGVLCCAYLGALEWAGDACSLREFEAARGRLFSVRR